MEYEIILPFEDADSIDAFNAEWADYCDTLREIAEGEEIAIEVQNISQVW